MNKRRATFKLGRKTVYEHRHVIYQSNQKESLTLVGGIRFTYKGFKAESLMPDVFTKKVLQKHLYHNRG